MPQISIEHINITTVILGALLVILLINYAFSISTIITDGREVHSKYVWLLILIFLPIIGFLFYLFFGKNTRNPGNKRFEEERERFKNLFQSNHLEEQQKAIIEQLKEHKNFSDRAKLISLVYNNSLSYILENNAVEILQSGELKFRRLLNDLSQAKKYIHMDYYIWQDDQLTRKVREVLIQKAREGLEIRILVDHLGSLSTPSSYFRPMKKAGIKFEYSYSFRDIFRFKDINFRDHRKIVVIDGEIGYLGGMNMGEEYITGGKQFKAWRDTHLRIQGDQVIYLQALFTLIWEKFYDEKLDIDKYLPISRHEVGKIPLQISTSGPQSGWNSIEQVYFQMIADANEIIRIQSPYFIPSEALLAAIKSAALSGIKVKFMMTGIPDSKITWWAAHRYIKEVLEAGAEVYMYMPGYFHSKTISVDSKYCSIGTANMDIRSLRINYEINTVIYDEEITKKLEQDFENDIQHCIQITDKDFEDESRFRRIRNEICALMSPIL